MKVSKKKTLEFVLGVFVLGGILYAGNLYRLTYSNSCNGQAGSRLYKEAASAYKSADTHKVSTVASKMRSAKNESQDINCLYIVAVDDFNKSDKTGAAKTIAQLKSAYQINKKFVPDLTAVGINSITDLSAQIDRLVNRDPNHLNSHVTGF